MHTLDYTAFPTKKRFKKKKSGVSSTEDKGNDQSHRQEESFFFCSFVLSMSWTNNSNTVLLLDQGVVGKYKWRDRTPPSGSRHRKKPVHTSVPWALPPSRKQCPGPLTRIQVFQCDLVAELVLILQKKKYEEQISVKAGFSRQH